MQQQPYPSRESGGDRPLNEEVPMTPSLNDAGVPMELGNSGDYPGYDGSRTFYCGRKLGSSVIPGSDGQCGPSAGPQCLDCKRAQQRMAASIPDVPPFRVYVPPISALPFSAA